MYMSVIYCYMLCVCDMLYVCDMSSSRALLLYVYVCYMLLYVICLLYVLGYMLFNAHLCNHILLQSGGGTWGTVLYTVRDVGSESRDVDA